MPIKSAIVSGRLPALAVAAAFLGFAANVSAQEVDELGESDASILKTAVELGTSYTDNFYHSGNPGRGVLGGHLKPKLAYSYILPRFKFTADGTADLAGFNSGGEDNYADVRAGLGLGWAPAERHSFAYGTNVKLGHDPLGTERTAGSALQDRTLDRWRTEAMNITYQYGLPSDILNAGLRVIANNKRYTTNVAVTQFIEHSSVSGGATLFYNLGPRTAVLFDVSQKRTNFDKSERLSSVELQYLTGMRWLASAKTSGDIRVGFTQLSPRNTTSSGFRDFSGLAWQAKVRWAPLAYRTFVLQTGRDSQASYSSNVSFNDVRYGALEWSEEFSSKLTTTTSVNLSSIDFVNSSRTDDWYVGNVSADYKVSRYTTLVGKVGYEWRDSTINSIDCKKYTTYLGVRYAR